jgi:hypothetical protein
MAFLESQGRRTAFLWEKQLEMGLQSHVENQSFDKFDVLSTNNTVLASNNSKFIGCQS